MKLIMPLVLVALPGLALAQGTGDAKLPGRSNATEPAFAVATIKPSDPNLPGYGTRISPGQFMASSYSLRLLTIYAYDLHRTQVLGGPAWLDSDKYNIVAKPDGGVDPTPAQWKIMLQKLLADRFGLRFHRETRTLSVYILTVAKEGPKLAPAGDSDDAIGDISFHALGKLGAKHASMADFVHSMQKNVLDLPIVDQTGLSGRYDFTLNWVPDEFQFSEVKTPAGSRSRVTARAMDYSRRSRGRWGWK